MGLAVILEFLLLQDKNIYVTSKKILYVSFGLCSAAQK